MTNLNVIEFPGSDCGDVAKGLRALADQIEAGEFDDAHNVAWVIDRGNAVIDVGLLGHSAEPAPVTHFLLALAMRKLESVIE